MRRRVIAAAIGVAFVATVGASISFAGSSASRGASCSGYDPVLDPAHFVGEIDNPYYPLPVGRTLIYRGVRDGRSQVDRVTVTNETKVIQGISATVVLDVAKHRGAPIERTVDWFAQDDRGVVWYLGERTRSFLPNGGVSTEGSWEAGVDGAKAGIIMEADPQIPDAYRQECLSGHATDTAWTISRGGPLRTPYGTVRHVVRSLEFTQLEPDVVDQKYYAPGIGIVLEQSLAGDHEVAKLVSLAG